MSATCTRCYAEPRHGSSPKCVRCLWPDGPRPGERWRSNINGIIAEVVAVDSTSVTYSVDGPDGGTWTVPRTMFVDGCERVSLTPQAREQLAAVFAEIREQENLEECARCGTVGPVDVPCAGCQASAALAAESDRLGDAFRARTAAMEHAPGCRCGVCEPRRPFDRNQLGLADAGSTTRPAPPCCARIGAWWCLREQGHDGECETPHTRGVETVVELGRRR